MSHKMTRIAMTVAVFTVFLVLPCSVTRSDLKFQESTKISGGMIEGVSKMMGIFGAKGLDKTLTTTQIKGDLMRTDHYTGEELVSSEITRLDSEEIISLDHKKKKYSVMTFAQMRERLEKAMNAMSNPEKQSKSKDSEVDWKVKASVKDGGESKVINGFHTKKVLMTIEMEAQNKKDQSTGTMMLNNELWVTKDISGFAEQARFYQKYAQKMGAEKFAHRMATSPAQAGMTDPRMRDAMAEMAKEMSKLDGVPVLTISSFNLDGSAPGESGQPRPQSSQSSSTESAQPENVGKTLGKALGGFGGFGGFGKKKKKEEPVESSAPETAPSAAGPANLMTSTTELKNYSNATLDSSLFEIPAGYKLEKK
ncbi:MAG: hypothetical protein AB1898_07765 [Acidobacteriota bacterium]